MGKLSNKQKQKLIENIDNVGVGVFVVVLFKNFIKFIGGGFIGGLLIYFICTCLLGFSSDGDVYQWYLGVGLLLGFVLWLLLLVVFIRRFIKQRQYINDIDNEEELCD